MPEKLDSNIFYSVILFVHWIVSSHLDCGSPKWGEEAFPNLTGFTNLESDPTLVISHLESKNREFTTGNHVYPFRYLGHF
jgi:hypothetical protein